MFFKATAFFPSADKKADIYAKNMSFPLQDTFLINLTVQPNWRHVSINQNVY